MPPKKFSLPPNPPSDPSQNLPLQYTTFFSVAPLNAKNVSSSYLKTEAQTWISRSQAALAAQLQQRSKKRKRPATESNRDADRPTDLEDSDDDRDQDEHEQSSDPASKTIVIHPGSEYIRIGKATDLFPLTLPNAIARRPKVTNLPPLQQTNVDGSTDPIQSTANPNNIDNNGTTVEMDQDQHDTDADADAEDEVPDEDENKRGQKKGKVKATLDQGIEAIRNDLRAIMRQEKLRSTGNGKTLAANYNDGVQPEDVPEHNDLFGLEWTDKDVGGENDVYIGEQALRLACFSEFKSEQPSHNQTANPLAAASDASRSWKLFRPFKRGTLDLNGYQDHYGSSAAIQALLGDIRMIFQHAITSPLEDSDAQRETDKVEFHGLGVPMEDLEDYSVILILPDLFSRSDAKALVSLLLQDMGFSSACIQTESVCSTFGAGLSSACVVDIGAEYTSISCVEEGLVLPETRLQLSYGGKDISTFLGELLVRAKFPYCQLDWRSNLADAMLLDSLKERLVTLNPSDVGLNIHDFYVRLPNRPTMKYLFRTYDELILGPMSLFDPLVFDLDKKKLLKGKFRAGHIEDQGVDDVVVEDAPELSITCGHDVAITAAMQSCVKHLLPPPPPPPSVAAGAPASVTAAIAGGTAMASTLSETGTPSGSVPPPNTANSKLIQQAQQIQIKSEGSVVPSRTESPAPPNPGAGADVGLVASGEASARPSPAPGTLNGCLVRQGSGTASGGQNGDVAAEPAKPTIDIFFEASKTPLDLAIYNCLLASIGQAGPAGEERLKKMSNNILCVGGTALIPGLSAALEARLTALLGNYAATMTGDASNAPKVTVIPPPRDMDPRVLAWKGMSVFARLEGATEMRVRKEDWDLFGYRSLKEKTLFL